MVQGVVMKRNKDARITENSATKTTTKNKHCSTPSKINKIFILMNYLPQFRLIGCPDIPFTIVQKVLSRFK